jgi:hypothetical protein
MGKGKECDAFYRIKQIFNIYCTIIKIAKSPYLPVETNNFQKSRELTILKWKTHSACTVTLNRTESLSVWVWHWNIMSIQCARKLAQLYHNVINQNHNVYCLVYKEKEILLHWNIVLVSFSFLLSVQSQN